jgi:hypothetical protein
MLTKEQIEAELHRLAPLWRTEDFCEFMPTAEAAEDRLRFLGFAEVARLTPPPGLTQRYLDGRRVALIATRS